MRLFVTPLIRALKSIVGPHPFLVYLDTFRYPLAGEVSMDVDLVRRNRIPYLSAHGQRRNQASERG